METVSEAFASLDVEQCNLRFVSIAVLGISQIESRQRRTAMFTCASHRPATLSRLFRHSATTLLTAAVGLTALRSGAQEALPPGYLGPPQLIAPPVRGKPQTRTGAPTPPRPPTLPNVRVNDKIDDELEPQSETSVAADPTNPLRLVGGFNDCRGFFDPSRRGISGWGYSIDGGRTWTGVTNGLPRADLADFGTRGDPSIDVDSEGNFYFASLYSSMPLGGGALNVSVNRGRFDGTGFVWEPATLPTGFTSGFGADKDHVGVDKRSGYVYVTYTNFSVSGGGQIEIVRSTDGARTWSNPVVLATGSSISHQGSVPRIGPDGEIYVAWEDGLQQASTSIHIRKSIDWPNFEPDVVVASVVSARNPPFNDRTNDFPALAVDNTNGPHRGHVYVVWNDGRFGGSQRIGSIVVAHSPDGAEGSWGEPIRLDDDASTVDRWFPWLAIDPTGAVFVAWYDRRLAPPDSPFLTDTFGTRFALETGASPNFRITDQSFPMNVEGFCIPRFGDYNGAAVGSTRFHYLWGDGREGNPDTYAGGRQTQPIFADPETLEVCTLGMTAALVTVVGGPLGFQGDVALDLLSPIDTITATFDPNPVPEPAPDGAESILQLSAAAETPPGTYVVSAVGTDGTSSVTADLKLVVSSGGPGPAEQLEPPDGQVGALERTTFAWTRPDGASTYRLRIFAGEDCAGPAVREFNDLTETRFTVPVDQALDRGSVYSWIVIAQNACDTTPSARCFGFRTRVCGPELDLVANGGFEEGLDGWTIVQGAALPVLTTDQAHSGVYSTRFGVTGPSGRPELYQTVQIPADANDPRLVFWFRPQGTPACIFSLCEEHQAFIVRPEQPDRPVYLWRDISPTQDWVRREFGLEDFRGQTIELHFRSISITLPMATSGFYLDDVSLNYELCGA
jgi:hypothetical protein